MNPLTLAMILNAGSALIGGMEKNRQAKAQQMIDMARSAWSGFGTPLPAQVALGQNLGASILQGGLSGLTTEGEASAAGLSKWLGLGQKPVGTEATSNMPQLEMPELGSSAIRPRRAPTLFGQ